MIAASAEFLAALKQSHTIVTRADVVSAGTILGTLDILGGSVTVDSKSEVRRRATVSLADPAGTLVPNDLTSLVAPGHELILYRGIKLNTGVSELFPLGVFGISSTNVSDSPTGLTIAVDAYDRARKVQRAGFPTPYVVAAGTEFAVAIKALIQSKVGGILADTDYLFTGSSMTTPQLIFGVGNGDDPWKFAQEMATAVGMELFFDASGKCVLRPPPISNPQITYTEGENATILSVQKAITDEETWNHIIVIGNASTATGAPIRAEARDTDPTSPTYYLGTFGDVPFPIYVNPYIVSQSQAQQIADLLLQAIIGYGENVSLSIIPNPTHEAGDSISIVRSDSKINSAYVIESFTVPMDAQTPMPVVCKRRRVV